MHWLSRLSPSPTPVATQPGDLHPPLSALQAPSTQVYHWGQDMKCPPAPEFYVLLGPGVTFLVFAWQSPTPFSSHSAKCHLLWGAIPDCTGRTPFLICDPMTVYTDSSPASSTRPAGWQQVPLSSARPGHPTPRTPASGSGFFLYFHCLSNKTFSPEGEQEPPPASMGGPHRSQAGRRLSP